MLTPTKGNPLFETKPESIAFDCSKIEAPTVLKTVCSKAELKRIFREKNAAEAIGELTKGIHLFGLTKGQFSIIDILTHLLAQTGKAELSISTWTASKSDLSTVQEFLQSDQIQRLRFLIDFSFQRRAPDVVQSMRDRFGSCIRVTKNHAKFYLIKNEQWKIVIRTSMNLNFNPRLEDFTVEDNPALFDFLDKVMNEFFETQPNNSTEKTTKWHLKQFRSLK